MNKDDPLRKVLNKIMVKEDNTPADRLLSVMIMTLQTTRNKFERELIKGLLLKAGITSVTNNTNRDFVIRK